MRYCPSCGGHIAPLRRGGCGGRGRLCGCEQCDTVYEQTNGGIVPSLGGPQFRRVAGPGLRERRLKLSEDIEPYKHKKGKWSWSEIGGSYHTFRTKKAAQIAIEDYRARLLDELQTPVCPDCNVKSRTWGLTGRSHQCPECGSRCFSGNWREKV